MSILSEASDFIIRDSNLIQITNSQYGQSGIDSLHAASIPGAAFDSQDHYDRRCFPGTREQYISDITNWVTESVDAPSSMYWMRGPAGVGKSSIAQTCAEKLKKTGHLGAAFFFTVNQHNNPWRLFTTIAYELTTMLPDYRTAVDERISKDKNVVEKKLPSQFESLIIEPFQELKKQGKRIQPKAIFIDGLDECTGEAAQAEIIETIASSVRAKSTPFCWAIFSRAEPRIVSTFNQNSVASVTHSIELPISREADAEIEMYLQGEFRNILERRGCRQLLSVWPSDSDIQVLVNAADGLFAHPAAVLRHVAYPPDWQFRERLQSVLNALYRPGKQSSVLPFSQLDTLYIHIMSQIPSSILLFAQFLLYLASACFGSRVTEEHSTVAFACGALRISESIFRDVCDHLHAVIAYEVSFNPLSLIDSRIRLTRSFYDQGRWFNPDLSIQGQLLSVHGSWHFYHKSFYDFLNDPVRSSIFCVNTPAFYIKFFDHLIQQHHQYALSCAIDGSKLVLAQGTVSSSSLLAWPQGTEFVDSFLGLLSFYWISRRLSHDNWRFCQHIGDIPLGTLRQLAELDYRMSLVVKRSIKDFYNHLEHSIFGIPGIVKTLPHTLFACICTDKFNDLVPATILSVVEKLEKAKIIRPYSPHFGSSRVTSLLHNLLRTKSVHRNSGLFKYGHGDKSIIWYWEFDAERRYFHEFRTIDYDAAIKYYKANKFTMWEGKETESGQEDDQEDGEEGEGGGQDDEEERDPRRR